MSVESENHKKDGLFKKKYKEAEFIPIDDLVYAPLQALSDSNRQLREQAIVAVRSFGTPKPNGKNDTIKLKDINIAYDQVKPESDDGRGKLEEVEVKVPLLSIVPLSNLIVEEAEIDFSAEIQVQKNKENITEIKARICSPDQRVSDFLPRVSYKIKVKSQPAEESILRITDQLCSNQIVQISDEKYTYNGNVIAKEQAEVQIEIERIKGEERKLRFLYQQIKQMIDEQENMLQSGIDLDIQFSYTFDKDKYTAVLLDITKQLMNCQEQIVNLQIKAGLG